MNILIIDADRKHAQLGQFLDQILPEGQMTTLNSIKHLADYFKKGNSSTDLIFISLNFKNRYSFELIHHFKFDAPVIYLVEDSNHDHYDIPDHNVLYNLTQPLTIEQVRLCLDRYRWFKLFFEDKSVNFDKNVCTRLLVKSGHYWVPIQLEEISIIYFENGNTFLQTLELKTYLVNGTLDSVENKLSKKSFFRLNRQIISHIKTVEKFNSITGGRIEVCLKDRPKIKPIVSFKRREAFLNWLTNNTDP